MKGLIRNNFYSVQKDLRIIYPLCLIALIVSVIYGDPQLTYLIALVQMLMCFGHIGTGLKNDFISKWNKYEITLPVRRRDVITARYLSFLLFDMIGVLFGLATFMLANLTGNVLSMERVTYIFSFGIYSILLTPALMHPALLRFGEDKSEQFIVYALMASIGIMLGLGELAKMISPPISDILFRIFLISFSLVVFVVSYLLSLRLYTKKDLL